jgi:hypothetical protein
MISLRVLLSGLVLLVGASSSLAEKPLRNVSVTGGFIEKAASTAVRPLLTAPQIQAFLPARGLFTFPAPYQTTGIRITNASDCGGSGDCVESVGYSYWRVINNHVGSNMMYLFLTLNRGKGGTGPTLFSYDKTTQEVKNLGPLFDGSSALGGRSAEQWYFSGTLPTKLYVFASATGATLYRYDVISRQTETVFDADTQYPNRYIWQPHSSNDDRVHSATLRDKRNYQMLGCMVYREDTKQFSFYASQGGFDECHIDKSGRWLTILDNVDGQYGLDNRIIDLQNGTETLVLDQKGGAGHMDTGYGIMVGEDNWASQPGAVRLYTFAQTPLPGPVVYHATDWSVAGHVSFQNATDAIPTAQQFACNSYVNRKNVPRGNEIVCYRLDASLDVLVVAPVMTDLKASGGGSDDYAKMPKGALDITGEYFIWASNMGDGRQDAFMVKVPAQLLGARP